MDTGRTRGANGRFVRRNAAADTAALEKIRIRQRKFLARRVREKKRIMSTFLASFVIQEQNKDEHWMPGRKKDYLLLDLMESLIKDKFLDARGSRLAATKKKFFKLASGAAKKRLPRIRVYPAEKSEEEKGRTHAFVGWRFPSPMDSFELDSAENWLKKHESKLRISVSEAKQVCIDMFSRYVRRPNRFMFVGFPSSNTPDRRSPPLDLSRDGVDHTSGHAIDVGNSSDLATEHQSNMTSSEMHTSTAHQMSRMFLSQGQEN